MTEDFVVNDGEDQLLAVLIEQSLFTETVDDFTLFIHDVIIFKRAFTD